jgi:osmotically-inducible protein OsmY
MGSPANDQPELSIGPMGNTNGTTDNAELLVPLPGPDRPAVTKESDNTAGSLPAPEQADNGANLAAHQFSIDDRGTARARIDAPPENQHRPAPRIENSRQHNQQLKSQIAKAIESRAIIGVEVSVVQGTAFLDGHVATERQRRAAERAARSVAGVERVRNRIAITFG